MAAPDKIYLSVGKGEDWAYAMWTQKTPEEQKFSELDEHEEYIRKNALLKWIQEVRTIPHENAIARDLAFQEVVNKLNSM